MCVCVARQLLFNPFLSKQRDSCLSCKPAKSACKGDRLHIHSGSFANNFFQIDLIIKNSNRKYVFLYESEYAMAIEKFIYL